MRKPSKAGKTARDLFAKGLSKKEIIEKMAKRNITAQNGDAITARHLAYLLKDKPSAKKGPWKKTENPKSNFNIVPIEKTVKLDTQKKVVVLMCDMADLKNLIQSL
jgi:hypothetical protein